MVDLTSNLKYIYSKDDDTYSHFVCVYINIYTHTYVCMYVCMYVRTHTNVRLFADMPLKTFHSSHLFFEWNAHTVMCWNLHVVQMRHNFSKKCRCLYHRVGAEGRTQNKTDKLFILLETGLIVTSRESLFSLKLHLLIYIFPYSHTLVLFLFIPNKPEVTNTSL